MIEKVKKVRICGLNSVRNAFLKKIQDAEILHVEEIFDLDSSQGKDILDKIKKALSIISRYEEKKFMQDIFQDKTFIKKEDFYNFNYTQVYSYVEDILRISTHIDNLTSERERVQKLKDFLYFLRKFTLPLKELFSFKYLTPLFIKVDAKREKEFIEMVSQKSAGQKFLDNLEKEKVFVVFAYKEETEEMLKVIQENNFQILVANLEDLSGFFDLPPAQILEKINSYIEEIDTNIKRLEQNLKSYLSYKEKLLVLHDFYLNLSFTEKVDVLLPKTKEFFVVEGWILEKELDKLNSLVESFQGALYAEIYSPQKEENPPVKLVNKKIFTPFELIVRMYGAPHYTNIDPTVYLAPFFFLSVGICISDAGYGLILSLLSIYILRRKKLTTSGRNFFKLIFFLGISTFLVGILLGGWWGVSAKFKVIDIIKEPFKFLIFCFFIGFIQVLLGMGLKSYIEFKNKNYSQGISALSWIVLLTSILGFFTLKYFIFKYLILLGVLGIILFSSSSKNILVRIGVGLYELYGISKYFSDVLSYSRLLALGMATGVIAMVINILAKLSFNMGGVGVILGIPVLVGGHLFNIFINLMSGFIHSARLQFVEFFSKFLVLGSRFFEPFKIKTRYINLY